ncbi:sporulation protein SsgA [Streptomyces sp. NPDC019443]|uniref:sporulation protein SsgA n=1 Tax=Streptomyces sp. NPDC019443 TaxID=3365061 RepID=UPI0037B65136
MVKKQQPEIEPAPTSRNGLTSFLASKAIPFVPPFAVWLAEWPVALAAHWQWGGSSVASAFLTLAAVGVTGTTLWAGIEARMKMQRLVQATATAAAATGWFAAAAIGGPTHELAVNSWLMGGPTIALLWAVKMVMRTSPDQAATSENSEEKGLLAKIGLARAQAKGIKAEPNKVTVPVELDRGKQTHDDAAKAAKGLAGVLGVPENAVRWERDPEDAGRGQYVVIPEDMLKTPTPWPGPSAPGGSIGDAPIPIGIYEDGPAAGMWFSGDEEAGRNAGNWQLMGMTGAGKSQGGRVSLTDLMTRRDVAIIAMDPSKGVQTFGPILGGIDWAAFTMAECRAVISSLPAMITARANELGKHGYDQWTPEAGAKLNMPYLIIWCEEVAKLFREGEDLLPTIQEIRSAGGSLVFSLQRSSHTVMDTDVRANIAGGAAFGVNSSVDAGFVLSDDTIDAGARPEQWKNLKPGYCYLEGPGIPEDRFATPVRTYLLDKDYATQVIAAYSSVRFKGLGPVTEQAAGQAYAGRKRYTSISQAAQPVAEPAGEEGLDADDMALHQTDPEYADLHVDIDKPLPPVPGGMDIPLASAPPETKSREQALEELEQVLNEFVDRGQLTFGPKDITPELGRIGKSASWVRKEFRRLETEGLLSTTDEAGIYRINVPAHA